MDDSFENWLKERTSETAADDGRLSPGTVIGAYRVETFLVTELLHAEELLAA